MTAGALVQVDTRILGHLFLLLDATNGQVIVLGSVSTGMA
jgi:hypothetical protein